MNKKLEEYKFDHFKNIDEVMHYFNCWYKEEDVYSINRYLSLKDFNYISNKYQELQKENKQLKDNWNELKEWASNFYNSEEVGWAGCGMRYTLEKIQELEQGSDNK